MTSGYNLQDQAFEADSESDKAEVNMVPLLAVNLKPVVSKHSRDLSIAFLCRVLDVELMCESRRKCLDALMTGAM